MRDAARVLCIAVSALAACATVPTDPGRTDATSATVDLAGDFLATACRAAPAPDFARAWLAHEERHWDFAESRL